jgi:hypothetical protein
MNQGKLPVCPTLAPRFSFFQSIATGHEGSSGNRQDLQNYSGLNPIHKTLRNPVNIVYFYCFRASLTAI